MLYQDDVNHMVHTKLIQDDLAPPCCAIIHAPNLERVLGQRELIVWREELVL